MPLNPAARYHTEVRELHRCHTYALETQYIAQTGTSCIGDDEVASAWWEARWALRRVRAARRAMRFDLGPRPSVREQLEASVAA